MVEDILQEETIELRPKERISALLQGETQRDEIEEFAKFQLSRENLKTFYYMTKKEYAKDFYLMSFFIDKIINEFKIHPDFNKYFAEPMKEKPNTNPSNPTLLTKSDILNSYKRLMDLFRDFIPTLDMFTTVSIEVPRKLFTLNIGTVPGIVDRRGRVMRATKTFGTTRSDKAYLMFKEGKDYGQIQAELMFKDRDDTSSYVKMGEKRAIALGIDGKSTLEVQKPSQ